MIERANHADPATTEAWRFPYFRAAQGLARYRQGDFEGAVASIDPEVSQVLGPFPHLVLAMAHHGAGRVAESLRSLTTAMRTFDWSPSRMNSPDDWMFHALAREAKALVMPDLDALLARQRGPRDEDERLALIAVCVSMGRTAMATDLYAEAVGADSAFLTRRGLECRYDAARCATQAGCGEGADASALSDEQRATRRDQALRWLSEVLPGAAASSELTVLAPMLDALSHDPAFAGVRDEARLQQLPTGEQQAWASFWRDVDSALARAKQHDPVKTR